MRLETLPRTAGPVGTRARLRTRAVKRWFVVLSGVHPCRDRFKWWPTDQDVLRNE